MKKILLVDDSDTNNILLQSIFEEFNFDIKVASSGKKALKQVSEEKFDLIILDIIMPGISGLELVKNIEKSIPEFNTPVIFVTAANYKEEQSKINNNFVVDFFEKPINIETLTKKVKEILKIN